MKFDIWRHEAVNIVDKNIELSIFATDIEPSIGRVVGYQYYYEDFDGEAIKQELDLGPCSEERMNRLTEFWSPRLGSEGWAEVQDQVKCVNDDVLNLQGTISVQKNYKSIGFHFLHCREDPTKREDECQNEWMTKRFWKRKSGRIGIAINIGLNQIDMRNQTQQIQHFNSVGEFSMFDGRNQIMTYKLALNEYTDKSDSFGFLSSDREPYSFMSVESLEKHVDDSPDTQPHIQILLELADIRYESERQVYTFFAMIGDIGGFNGAIIILPAFLMA